MNSPERTASPFPPLEVTGILRLEGLLVLLFALAAFHFLGGNWWLFATLLLVPDLTIFGALKGGVAGTRVYNAAHSYAVPAIVLGLSLLAGWPLMPSLMVIWVAHIGMDRAVGYGLKYPGQFRHTHLGLMGRTAKKGVDLANAA